MLPSVWRLVPPVSCPRLAGLVLVLAAPLLAQNTNNNGLQGDPSILTPGGWISPAAPPDNPQPVPPDPYLDDRIQLGKALFWDEQVSTSNTMACATCHIPGQGGVDPRPAGLTLNSLLQPVLGSFGVVPQSDPAGTIDYGLTAPPSNQETRMITQIHVPTMIGAYMFNHQFWDMRAGPVFNFSGGGVLFPDWASLENQAVGPPTSDIEMGHQNVQWATGVIENKLNDAAPLALVPPASIPASIPTAWLSLPYSKVFDIVFAPSAVPAIANANGVTRERFAMALAAYMRTLIPDQAPIDTNTMTRQQLVGFDVFVHSGCGSCHSASGNPVLVNRTAPFIGTLQDPWDNSFSDGQQHDIFGANPARSVGRVKTPTLRNVGLRGRYFHDGHGRIVGGVPMNSIADVVDFYDIDQDPANGGPGSPFELVSPGGSSTLTPFERACVIDFLQNALTDPRVAAGAPPFDHPTLFTMVQPFNSNHSQAATPAAPGWQPLMIADVPALVEPFGGPGWWKVGVGSTGGGVGGPIIPPGSCATLWMDNTDSNPAPFYLPYPVLLTTLWTTPEGFATAHVPVVLTPSMIGTTAFLQWVVTDRNTGDIGYSESAWFTVL